MIKYLQSTLFVTFFLFWGCGDTSQIAKVLESERNLTNNPLYMYQWHINPVAKSPSIVGDTLQKSHTINLEGIMERGRGVSVAVVDVGVQMLHEDLHVNKYRSYRFSDKSHDATPLDLTNYENAHGTACAGIIAAQNNNIGVVGIAYDADLIALNVGSLSSVSDATLSDALGYKDVDVSSNSWGSPNFFDDSMLVDAIEERVVYGRDGKGEIFVFAPGNRSENSEFQEILTSGNVINVSALSASSTIESYSARGANILVAAYGGAVDGAQEPAIVTTDFMGLYNGFDSISQDRFDVKGNENANYTRMMNGTSAAAPMVSGVVALMLEANPNLTYRDVQYILATTARRVDLNSSSWFKNSAGYYVSNLYGYGCIDAQKAVQKAKDFSSLGVMKEDNTTQKTHANVLNSFESELNIAQNFKIEQAELILESSSLKIDDVNITLISPSKTVSVLTTKTKVGKNLPNRWRFLSTQFLDESSQGVWKLRISTLDGGDVSSIINTITLKVKGH